jgi:dTDP-4-amino-4,6-dideoxygalactose transaminase
MQPAIEDRFGKQPSLPRTEEYVKRILSLPMFPSLTETQVAAVSSAIKGFLARK